MLVNEIVIQLTFNYSWCFWLPFRDSGVANPSLVFAGSCFHIWNLSAGEWRIKVWKRDGINQYLAKTTSKFMAIFFWSGVYTVRS
jgi:hypothetical protein